MTFQLQIVLNRFMVMKYAGQTLLFLWENSFCNTIPNCWTLRFRQKQIVISPLSRPTCNLSKHIHMYELRVIDRSNKYATVPA